jgi:biopolymer transport protein ExbD
VLKRPSVRRKRLTEQVNLNLVPVLDTMVTLIAFLLYTMSWLVIVAIESNLPQINPADVPEKIKERPLQLTLSLREGEAEIWSPFDRIKAKKIPNTSEGTPDTLAIHNELIEVKKLFPKETTLVLSPQGKMNYDSLIGVMDASRTLEPGDPPVFLLNPETGVEEQTNFLFPNVVFGNLLGD